MLISLAVSNYDCYVFLDTGLLWPLCWMLGIGCEHIVLDRCGWYLLLIAITDTSYCCYYLPPLLPFVLVLHHTKTSLNGSASCKVHSRNVYRSHHSVHSQWHGGDFFGYRRPWCEINDDQSEEDRTIGKYALSVNALAHRLQHVMLACGPFLWTPPELVERCATVSTMSVLTTTMRIGKSWFVKCAYPLHIVLLSALTAAAFTSKRHHHQSLMCPSHPWQSLKCLLNSGFVNIENSSIDRRSSV